MGVLQYMHGILLYFLWIDAVLLSILIMSLLLHKASTAIPKRMGTLRPEPFHHGSSDIDCPVASLIMLL